MPFSMTRGARPPLDGKLREDRFYEEIGFRSGLEIHQQLLTRGKLFCRCPAGRYSEKHDAVVLRHMRPTLSELGEYDGTALMEFKTRKEVLYLLNAESVCTYEMDDTPPFPPDGEALDIALVIMLLLHCKPVGEMHVSRKQYLDGSIPTGFQRTAILGVEGEVPVGGRRIGLFQLAIEEDACREVSDIGHRITFRTDRLSMPLIEAVTKPEMRNPHEVAAVCEQLGRLFRVTGKVRRGIGSVRQDVNVSVTGGTRVEIKGVSRIPMIPTLTHNEALRQKALLMIRDRALDRGIAAGTIDGGNRVVTDLLRPTRCRTLKEALHAGDEIRAVLLRGFQKALRTNVQPGIPFAQEFSGRIRVIACLDRTVNLFVRGEERGFGLFRHRENPALGFRAPIASRRGPSRNEWEAIAAEVGASADDGILLCFGPEADTRTAAQEILIRAREALQGVPGETRQPFSTGTTDFERILPGPDRMYPDTDLPPIVISEERLEAIRRDLPEYPWVREERYIAWGIDPAAARILAISPRAGLLEIAVQMCGTPPKDAARLLLQNWRDRARRGIPVERIPSAELEAIFREISSGDLHREGFVQALTWIATADGGNRTRPRPGRAPSQGELRDLLVPWLHEVRNGFRGTVTPERLLRSVMGVAMTRMAGRVPGRTVREIVEGLVADAADLEEVRA